MRFDMDIFEVEMVLFSCMQVMYKEQHYSLI